jgi:2-dehydro-3-deoxygluconokinase
MGAKGTLVATSARRERVPARQVKPVDATVAGDTLEGAFLAEYLRTDDPFRAAAYANAAAALSTQGYGAVAPMPRRPEVEAFMGKTA